MLTDSAAYRMLWAVPDVVAFAKALSTRHLLSFAVGLQLQHRALLFAGQADCAG